MAQARDAQGRFMSGSSGTQAAALYVTVGADVSGLNKGLGVAEAKVQGFSGNLRKLGSNIQSDLVGMAIGAIAVKTAFTGTIGAAIEWESQFAGVEKTVDGTAEELSNLEHELRGMAKTMPVARGELAAIAEQAGALGVATQDIGEFTEVVAQIGATTNVSSEQAATALGQLSNVLGLTQQDFDNFGAALVDLGNKGASTEAQILEIASRAGAGADLIGIAADATLGWSSAVANLGIEAEAGGSSLQRFFLGAAEHVGKAGEELKVMADTARVSVGEFTDLFNNDASAALQSFVKGLGELTQAEQLAVLEALGFNDVRIQRALLGLAGDADNLTDSLEIGAQAWADNTALVEEYGKRAKTTASRIEMLGNRISDLGVRLGESSGGPIDWTLTGVEASVSGWEKGFIDLELLFDDRANALADKIKDKSDILRNSSIAELLFGDAGLNQIRDNALAWGTSLEETITLMEQGLTPALVEQGRTWEEYQNTISGATFGAAADVRQGVSDITTSLDPLSDEMAAEMAELRAAAIAGTAATMQALLNLGNAEEYAAAWEAFLDGADEVWSDHEREAFIVGTFAGDAYNEGLHSGDSARVEETKTFVNDQLLAFELLNPGALAVGREVPEQLMAGMAEIYPELNQYLQERHGETLSTLTLDEAEQLGVDGIWLWWQGMRSEKQAAADEAERAAQEVLRELGEPDYYGAGVAAVGLFASGISEAQWMAQSAMAGVAQATRNYLPFSEPKDPSSPLRGLSASGAALVDMFASGIYGELGAGTSAMAAMTAAFTPDIGTGGLDMGTVFGTGGRGGGDTIINTTINLTVEGDLTTPERERSVVDLVGRSMFASGMSDRGVVGA